MSEIKIGAPKIENDPTPYMKVDQNLYDQPSFQAIIQEALGKFSGFTREEITTIFSRWAGFAKGHRGTAQTQEEVAEKMKKVDPNAVYTDVRRYLGLKDNRRGEVFNLVRTVLLPQLEKCPFWYEYLENRVGPGQPYKPDGTPQPGRVKENSVATYASWKKSRLRTKGDSNIVLEGIKDVFPKDVLPLGNRWTKLRAAEIINRK